MNKIVREKLKEAILLFIIIMVFGCVLALMLKYENEGEKNMPFKLEEMLVISSVDETEKKENPENYKRNIDIHQYNDVYLSFKKNEDYEESAYIENIVIDNIKVETNEKNTLYTYMPNSVEGKKFSYEDNFIVNSTLTYKGASQDNEKALEVGNQGGRILFRIVNKNVGEYVSNEDEEIAYDGTLLKKIGLNNENIEMKVSFDVIIETNVAKYRGNIKLNLPSGDILNEGVCNIDKKDFSDVAFKREK